MQTEMKVEQKGNELIVTIPMQQPTPSSTGKTLIVATGTMKTEIQVNGKPLRVGLNAYIKAN